MIDSSPPVIANIIYSLGTGGMENGLINIINRTPPGRYRHVVICLTKAGDFARRIEIPGIEIVELHKKEGKDLAVYWRLYKVLRDIRPSIVHSRNLAALDMQVIAFLIPGVRRVHGEHGRDIYDIDGGNWKYGLLRKIMRLFIDQYIAVSQDLEKWLLGSIRVDRNSLVQIYNGVDRDKFRPVMAGANRGDYGRLPAFSRDCIVIGSVGRLAEIKDQQLMLRAVHSLLSEEQIWRDKLRVVLVGDGPLREYLAALTMELGLQDVVWMPGDRNDIPEVLQMLDVFVLPSLGEGISNTVLEAMAAGLPVLATAVGGNPELVSDGVTGLLFPAGDIRALSEALKKVTESAELRKAMGEAALGRVQQLFDWDKTVAEYLDVYDVLLGNEVPGKELPESPTIYRRED